MASKNFRLDHLQTKPGICRVVFVMTGLVGLVVFGVASSNSRVIQRVSLCYPDWNCPPLWLASVSLAILVFTWIFPVAMLILSVVAAFTRTPGFKKVDFWGHIICGVLLFIAFVFITTFVIMGMLSKADLIVFADPTLFGIAGVLALVNSIIVLYTSIGARPMAVIAPGSHEKPGKLKPLTKDKKNVTALFTKSLKG